MADKRDGPQTGRPTTRKDRNRGGPRPGKPTTEKAHNREGPQAGRHTTGKAENRAGLQPGAKGGTKRANAAGAARVAFLLALVFAVSLFFLRADKGSAPTSYGLKIDS